MNVVLIFGARRTGTTLLNQILCNDPDANAHVGECQLLTRMLGSFRWATTNYDRVVQWYFDDYEGCRDLFRRQIDDFLRVSAAHFGGVENLVLKNPEMSRFKAEIDVLMPAAKQVICVRDPRDQIVSELDVGKRQAERGMDGDAAKAFKNRDVAGLAKKYTSYYAPMLSGEPENSMFVRYEDVIQALEPTLRKIEKFTGLDLSQYDPDSEWKRFEHKEQIRKMPAYVEQYGSALDASRVGRFRETLTEKEVETIDAICAEPLAKFYGGRMHSDDLVHGR
ncbi:MAG: sulfotransferase [Parvibaculum sp.]|nr:sulfotransferase [Parvibaculum sp.]